MLKILLIAFIIIMIIIVIIPNHHKIVHFKQNIISQPCNSNTVVRDHASVFIYYNYFIALGYNALFQETEM